MIGVILAAGTGRRLQPYTDTLPKALVPVSPGGNTAGGDPGGGGHSASGDDARSATGRRRADGSVTTPLDVILGNFARSGLTDVAIVVGYAAEAVRQRKKQLEERYSLRLELIDNPKATSWNNCYSLWCARDLFDQGVLLSNGDTIHPYLVEEILLGDLDATVGADAAGNVGLNTGADVRATPSGGTAPDGTQPAGAAPGRTARSSGGGSSGGAGGAPLLLALDTVKRLGEEEMKVAWDRGRGVRRITKLMDPRDAYGEYIGVCRIDPEGAEPLTDALETTWRKDPSLYYEDGFQEMINRGGLVEVAPIGDVPWIEIDDHADLARAAGVLRALAARE